MNSQKIKIGIGHPWLGRGGSEARVMWGIEALKDDYDLSLITSGDVNLDQLNQFYGTSLEPDEFRIRQAPIPFFLKRMAGGDMLRGAFYQRYCRKIATEYDILISTYNLCDFGVPAIHCIADFSWNQEIRKNLDPPPQGARGLFHRNSLLRKTYLSLARVVSVRSGRNLFAGEDLILANSRWSARIISEKYGTDIDVLYPPVSDNFPKVLPQNREMGFVYIGRIFPEKRIEKIIDILKRVRKCGYNIHLHIIGEADETTYGRFLENICQTERDWVVMEGRLFGEEKVKLLCQHSFGINARRGEAFGISVAEMVKAGCITFVPNEGGQVEIVNHSSLAYSSIEDAVEKIDAVLRQPGLQVELRGHLARQGEKFTISGFMNGLRDTVEKFMARRGERGL